MKFKTAKITGNEKIVIVILSTFLLLLPLIVFLNSIDVEWLDRPTTIGNNIGGLLAPVLSFIGSVLVYVAFKGQMQANQIIQEQFIKQNNDQLYFRLIDTLERKISSFSIIDKDDNSHSGYSFITFTSEQTHKRLNTYLSRLGFDAMTSKPQLFDISDFRILHSYIRHSEYKSDEDFMIKLFECTPKIEREKLLKNHNLEIGYLPNVNSFFKDLAAKNFYKFSIQAQMKYYKNCFQEYNSYPIFFHSYFIIFTSIITHINKSKEKDFYVNFLVENLTVFEKVIIFLYIATGRAKKDFRAFIKKYNVLEELVEYPILKIGKPENFPKHVESILNYDH
ncbi:MAG: hypothetical protein IR153_03920 [Flavobacterium sp.]|nr:hypothetical protein [Flavobacterium sp.]